MMFLHVLRSKYDQFGGRAGRREFWGFALVYAVLLISAYVVNDLLFGGADWYRSRAISSIYGLITLVPVLAVGARRLHDTGRNGWYQALALFWFPTLVFRGVATNPSMAGADTEIAVFNTLAWVFLIPAVVGTSTLVIFALMPGSEADNRYGQKGESPDRAPVFWMVLSKRYAAFKGRAGRKEFWLYMLVSFILIGIARWLDRWLFPELLGESGSGPVSLILFLATVVPTLALSARRLHDVGLSAWLLLLLIPPVTPIGLIVLLTVGIVPSEQGENKHGEPAVAPA